MVHATAVEGPGRRLRVWMVGGGRDAFIGAVHRMAMRLDALIEFKAGALSANEENARASGSDLGLAPTVSTRTTATWRRAKRRVWMESRPSSS